MTAWTPAAKPPALVRGSVHVWRIRLEIDQSGISAARMVLSPDEQTRADRYAFDRPRENFTVARAALRALLGCYLGIRPGAVDFVYGKHGKAELSPALNTLDLRFNVSHSDEYALVAVTPGYRIGIDIERCREIRGMDEVASVSFSEHELAKWRALPGDQRQQAFFQAWTRKEALVKAVGDGLVHPLRRFEVSFAPHERPRILCIEDDETLAARWSLTALGPADGYTAALAVEYPTVSVRCLEHSVVAGFDEAAAALSRDA